MDWKTLFQSLKEFATNPVLYLTAMLVSACLMFFPEEGLKTIRLDGIATRYAEWIGLIFLVSSTVVIIQLGIWIGRKIWEYYKVKRTIKIREKSLLTLYPKEKAIVIKMYLSPARSACLLFTDSSTAILYRLLIIGSASNVKDLSNGEDYFLQPWVCRYLDTHPEYIKSAFEQKVD